MPPVELIAHRGAPRECRENTLASFARALAHGADGVELDVHFSRDGLPVVHHDPAFGAVGRRPGAALAALRADEIVGAAEDPSLRVPLLREVAALVGARAILYVEVKAAASDADLRVLLDTVQVGAPALRFAVHSFDHRISKRLAGRSPHVPTGILSESYLVDTRAAMHAARARDLWQHWSQVDAALVADVHAAGGRVLVWTVNDPERARALVRLGVDALCTDDIPLLREGLAG